MSFFTCCARIDAAQDKLERQAESKLRNQLTQLTANEIFRKMQDPQAAARTNKPIPSARTIANQDSAVTLDGAQAIAGLELESNKMSPAGRDSAVMLDGAPVAGFETTLSNNV